MFLKILQWLRWLTGKMPIGLTTTTISTEGEIIDEWYNRKFLAELRSNLVFAGWGQMSTHPRNEGELVHWISIADFSAAGALTEGKKGSLPSINLF